MKYTQWIGIAAAIGLIISSFLPWTYYPDIDQVFTGIYSYENNYGRPGKALIPFAIICAIFFAIPRIWAKRWNLFFTVITFTYAIKSFILFSGCYRGICPTRLYGIWLTLVFSAIIFLAALFPSLNKKAID